MIKVNYNYQKKSPRKKKKKKKQLKRTFLSSPND